MAIDRMMVGTMIGASASRSISGAPGSAAHQAEGERHAEQASASTPWSPPICRAAARGVDPCGIVEVALVPLPRQARRRELQVGRRAERDRKHHQQRQHQEDVDEPAATAAGDGQDARARSSCRASSAARRAGPAHRRPASRPAGPPTARAANGQFRVSRTCCSISTAIMITWPPPSSAGVMKKPSDSTKTSTRRRRCRSSVSGR